MRQIITGFLLVVMGAPSIVHAQLRADEKKVTVDDQERTYFEFVPRAIIRQEKPVPLVLALHGGGGNARQMERYTRFNAMARREGFIVCYPEAYKKHWNDGREVDFFQAQSENVDDVKFIRQMVEAIAAEYSVDQSRVYSTGISNGAFMSHRLANDASDLVCAVAPVVGGLAEPIADSFRPKHPVSCFVIQGDADPLVPFDGGEVGIGPRKRGKLIPTKDAVAKYLKCNQIEGEPTRKAIPDSDPDDETTTEAFVYPPGKGGFKVQLYHVRNGGHTWPGTFPYAPELLIGKVSQDFNATAEIWKFFKDCPSR